MYQGEKRCLLNLIIARIISAPLDSSTPTPPPLTPGNSTPTPLPTPTPSATPVSGVVTPGSQVVSGGTDGTVQIWDATTGAHIFTYTGHQAGVNGVALVYNTNTSQNLVRIVSASDDGTAQVWYPGTSSPTIVYRGHRGKLNAVTTLSTVIPYYGPRIASASEDQTVQIWSIYQDKPLNTYREHHAPIRTVAASPLKNDNRIVSGDAELLHDLPRCPHKAWEKYAKFTLDYTFR